MNGFSRRTTVRSVFVALILLAALSFQPAGAGSDAGSSAQPMRLNWPELWHAAPAAAVTASQCMVDRFNDVNGANKASLGCTSNDVRLATVSLWAGGAQACIPGEPTTVTLQGDFTATASIRWDVGVFISTDGKTVNSKGTSCYQDILAYASTTNTDLNLTGGSGPFYNGELSGGATDLNDTCGDIQQGQNATRKIGPLTIICQDSNNNGQADVDTCTVWNNSGDTTPSCTSPLQISANTTSKCTCNRLEIAGLTTKPGLTVIKHVVNDNGGTATASQFTMAVTGSSPSPASFAGSETGTAVTLGAGSYSVSEIGPSGYTATYSADCSGTIANGDNKTCTVTNDDQAGSLIVKKVVVNDNGGTKVATDFSFSVNGGTATAFAQATDSLHGKNTLTVNAGSYTVTEPAVAGYTTTYNNCTNVVVPNGGSATCTITNDDQAATLIVKKVVVNDNGGTGIATGFSFSVNGGSAVQFLQDTDTLHGKNTLTVNAGSYTITEPAVTGYTTTYNNCTNVAIANGGTATCTITNDDTKASPGGTTALAWILHDSLAISGMRGGALDASSSSVTFSLYSDSTCNTLLGSETVGVSNSAASTVAGVKVPGTGTYYWRAAYSGDSYNNGFTTACGSEVTTIN